MSVLFWLLLTAFLVWAAGYLINEFIHNLRRARVDDLAPLTNSRKRNDRW